MDFGTSARFFGVTTTEQRELATESTTGFARPNRGIFFHIKLENVSLVKQFPSLYIRTDKKKQGRRMKNELNSANVKTFTSKGC